MISLKEIQNDTDHGDYVFTLILPHTQSSQKEEETIQVSIKFVIIIFFPLLLVNVLLCYRCGVVTS